MAFSLICLNLFEDYHSALPQLGCAAARSRLQGSLSFLSAAGKLGFRDAGDHSLQWVPAREHSDFRTGEVNSGSPIPWL